MLTIRVERPDRSYEVQEIEKYYVNNHKEDGQFLFKSVQIIYIDAKGSTLDEFYNVGPESEFCVAYIMNSDGRTVDVIK